MTNSDQNSPFTPPQAPPPPPSPEHSSEPFYQSQPDTWYYPPGGTQNKQRNIVGIIALCTAVAGFILACIPLIFVVGWILLPAALVLSIVGLTLSGKTKGTSIAALITSIVGCIVGVIVFLLVTLNVFSEISRNGDIAGSLPGATINPDEVTSGDSGSREHPAPLGTTFQGDDWDVTVKDFDPDVTDEVLDADSFSSDLTYGSTYALAELEVTYTGQGRDDPWFDVDVAYVTADNDNLYAHHTNADAPDNDIFNVGQMEAGETAVAKYLIEIPEDNEGVLLVEPGDIIDGVYVEVR